MQRYCRWHLFVQVGHLSFTQSLGKSNIFKLRRIISQRESPLFIRESLMSLSSQLFVSFIRLSTELFLFISELMIQPQLNSTLIPPHARAQTSASSGNVFIFLCRGLRAGRDLGIYFLNKCPWSYCARFISAHSFNEEKLWWYNHLLMSSASELILYWSLSNQMSFT